MNYSGWMVLSAFLVLVIVTLGLTVFHNKIWPPWVKLSAMCVSGVAYIVMCLVYR